MGTKQIIQVPFSEILNTGIFYIEEIPHKKLNGRQAVKVTEKEINDGEVFEMPSLHHLVSIEVEVPS